MILLQGDTHTLTPLGVYYCFASILDKETDSLCALLHVVLCFFFFFLFVFLGPHLWHIEVPRLGVKSELELLAYTTATATPDPSCIFDLHHNSWQCQILNPLSEARD